MKFYKSDLLETVEMLREADRRGYKFAVSPRGRRVYREMDIYAVPTEEGAWEIANFNGDWYVEPLDRLLRDVSLVADRYDLGEAAHVLREHELSFKGETLADDLKAIGIAHPVLYHDIANLAKDFGADFLSLTVGFDEQPCQVHLYPKLIDGQFRVTDYGVVLPREYGEVKHGVHNGIDSRELEQKFAAVDWSRSVEEGKVLSNDSRRYEVVAATHLYCDHASREDDPNYSDRLYLVNSLMAKYFKGTDMEHDLFATDPKTMGIFYDTVMFPRDINILVAAKRIDDPALVRQLSEQAYSSDNQKTLVMNLNNLENLQSEMKALGFKQELIEQMEKKMNAGETEFRLYDSVAATRGRVDLTLFFKQSSQSDYYYLNKFEVCHEKGRAIPEGQKIMVLTQHEGTDKGMTKSFVHIAEGIAFFNGQKDELKEKKSISHLVVGKDANSAVKLATMEDGKVNYVQKEFGQTYRTSPINQTVYVERGKGFSAEQAINLIQGRAVYRDDMVSQAGQQYKAWIKLDFDVPKDRFGNFMINQYTDPAYGFDLSKVLDKFEIKELTDPAKRELLESSIRNGNRTQVTVEKNGELVKLDLEAVPRYSQINLYNKDGKIEKREQFLKQTDVRQEYAESRDKAQQRNKKQGQGLGV